MDKKRKHKVWWRVNNFYFFLSCKILCTSFKSYVLYRTLERKSYKKKFFLLINWVVLPKIYVNLYVLSISTSHIGNQLCTDFNVFFSHIHSAAEHQSPSCIPFAVYRFPSTKSNYTLHKFSFTWVTKMRKRVSRFRVLYTRLARNRLDCLYLYMCI